MLRRFLPAMVATIVLATAAPGSALIPPDTGCRSGKVSITFDDGPSTVNTPRLLKILRAHRAQATFFVQGKYAVRSPKILRAMVRDGHAVEDHSWDHPALTTRPDRSVKRQLRLTKGAIRRITGQSPSFFRPPYGATSARVRRIARTYGLRQVLWTIDTRDWSGESPRQIRAGALKGLRRHRSNVILMHDAVTNSPATLKAVPGIIKGLRARGYCLVPLEPMMPLARVSARPVTITEDSTGSSLATVTFRLDGPTQRDGSFRVRSKDGTAVAGTDYRAVDRSVTVHRGDRSVSVHVRVFGDPNPNEDKTMSLRLDRARRLRIPTAGVRVTITDDGAWDASTARLITSTANAPASLSP